MDKATNTTEDIPEEFQYKEAEIDENDKKLLGVQDVTSAFMMASEMGKKFQSNQTIVTVLDENEEEAEEESSEVSEETRPGSGILQETLTEIASQEQDPVEEPSQESEEGEEEEEEDDDEEDDEANE